MRKFLVGLIILCSILFWTGCEKDDSNPEGEVSVTVSGLIMDKNGTALNGVSLSLGSSNSSTDGNGAFSITASIASGDRGLLMANFSGYLKGSYSFVAEANKAYTTKMILGQVDVSSTLNVSTGGTVSLPSGAQLVLPSNAVTLMDGSPYSGTTVKVDIQEINEDLGIAFSAQIPGNTLTALNSNNEEQELVSYGMLNVELYGDNNEALQLADGQTAALTFAIPAGQQAAAPATIGLWYFDETAGLWKEEGTATKQGNQYIGNVSHFTTWNCDDPHPPCTISGCVEDSLGNAHPNLTLQVGQITVQTDANGCFSAAVPAQFLPITILSIDYVQMQSCLLYSLSSVVSPASNYNVGTILLCSGHSSNWIVEVPNSIIGSYNLVTSVIVSVKDASGQGIAAISATAAVISGGGSVVSPVLTDGNGLATINWTMGGSGIQTLQVQVGSITKLVNGSIIVLGSMTDSRDANVYATVLIGNQTWMAENLRYDVPGNNTDTANSAISTTYGRLYDWATVMNGATTSSTNPSGVQGICPSGWHLPSDSEWNELEMALGMPAADTANTGFRGTHGTGMRSAIGWNFNGNGTNASGFNAFPAGDYDSGSFWALGDQAFFWSSTEYSSTTAWRRYLDFGNTGVYRYRYFKTYGNSCRCVKD